MNLFKFLLPLKIQKEKNNSASRVSIVFL